MSSVSMSLYCSIPQYSIIVATFASLKIVFFCLRSCQATSATCLPRAHPTKSPKNVVVVAKIAPIEQGTRIQPS